jgi:hypothetical protein
MIAVNMWVTNENEWKELKGFTGQSRGLRFIIRRCERLQKSRLFALQEFSAMKKISIGFRFSRVP